MKFTAQVVALIAVVALHHMGCAGAAQNIMDVGSCEELQQAVDLTVSSGNTIAVLTAGEIACDEWTTFEIENNRLQFTAQGGGPLDSDHVYAFENVRFLVSSGVLRADLAISFTTGAGGERQEVNGGVLNVAEGGYVKFNLDVSMTSVMLMSVTDEGSDMSPDTWFGGCIYNQGRVRFERNFMASDCSTVGGGETPPGNGGGIFNGDTGNMVFKGETEMTDCGTSDDEGNLGGAIYNEGKMTMFKSSNFFDNEAAGGGAIYSKGVIKFLKNALATFRGNRTFDGGDSGGQVSNFGAMTFKAGVIFEDGFTEANGGAISNSDTVIIKKSAAFKNNVASEDGGAISSPAYATFQLPDDTVFEGNSVRFDDGNCENWYQRTSQDNFDFVCLWE